MKKRKKSFSPLICIVRLSDAQLEMMNETFYVFHFQISIHQRVITLGLKNLVNGQWHSECWMRHMHISNCISFSLRYATDWNEWNSMNGKGEKSLKNHSSRFHLIASILNIRWICDKTGTLNTWRCTKRMENYWLHRPHIAVLFVVFVVHGSNE